MWAIIKSLDKTFCWSLVGVIIGLIGLGLGYYFYHASYRAPDLVYEILSSTNIIDIQVDTPKLDISYGGKRLTDSGNILKVISVRIINTGNDSLRKSDYVDEKPLGIAVTAGEIIETPEIIDTSNDYIREALKPRLVDKTKVAFSPVLFHASDFVAIKLLVVHKSSDNVNIVSDGLLANIKEVKVKRLSDLTRSKNGELSWGKLFSAALVGFGLNGLFQIFLIKTRSLFSRRVKCENISKDENVREILSTARFLDFVNGTWNNEISQLLNLEKSSSGYCITLDIHDGYEHKLILFNNIDIRTSKLHLSFTIHSGKLGIGFRPKNLSPKGIGVTFGCKEKYDIKLWVQDNKPIFLMNGIHEKLTEGDPNDLSNYGYYAILPSRKCSIEIHDLNFIPVG
jgi:hypothetical protein